MSDDKNKNLPSIDDFEDSNQELPSLADLVEEKDLPSVESYIEKEEEIEEGVQTLEDANGETFAEVKDVVPPWPELLRLVNDLKESIPEIPEIKSYDNELQELLTHIEEVKESIPEVPEVRYYEDEIESLKENIEGVRADIPKFPKWVNEVNEVPDFSWIGKTFSVIDEDFEKVNDNLHTLKDTFNQDIESLTENLELKDFEKKVEIKEVKEYLQETKDKIYEELKETALKIYEYRNQFKDDDRKLKKSVLSKLNEAKQNIEKKIDESNSKYSDSNKELKNYFNGLKEEVANLPEVKYYDKDIKKLSDKTETHTINIADLYKIVEDIKGKQEVLKEEIVNDRPIAPDPSEKQGDDPLTPTDQKFATLQDLAANYRLFVNRVEQQLYTIGGGGAGFIKDLDDVNFDATNNDLLIYQSDGSRWVGIASTALSGTPEELAEYCEGTNLTLTNLNVTGIATYEDVKNIDSIGIITGRSDMNIQGNARIVGILTVGSSSVTIDGDDNKVSVGIVTITNSNIILGDNVSINASATGINSAPNVFYVAKDGDDDNNGTSIDNAKLTIKAAVGIATSGSTVKVLSGTYVETNPIEVPANVSIVGDDQRSVNVIGSTPEKDIFSVRKGVKLASMTFQNHIAPAAAVGFPTGEIAENVGGGKWKGPYVQNCTSDTTTGTGIRIDGSQARLLKAMNVDSFTQYNQGGVGVAVTNGGFAQLVSLFTICCDEAVTCDAGGQADLANSNCSFGTKGLVARGVGPLQFTGIVTSTAAVSQAEVTLNINTPTRTISGVAYTNTTGQATVTTTAAHGFAVGMGVTLSGIGFTCAYGGKIYPHKKPYVFEVDAVPTTTTFQVNLGISTLPHTYVGTGDSAGTAAIDVDRPYDGQQCYFNTLFEEVQTITVTNGGSGYTSTPTVTLEAPSGSNGETATAFATLDGQVIKSITVISSGSQYTETPDVTISGGGGSSGAATANMAPIYYAINSSTPVVSGITTVTLGTNLLSAVGINSTAYFYQQSKIIASSHTFEYVGSGNTIATATPKRGGVTIQANEVVTSDGGKVIYTSTDQAGNFRIGDDLQINQETGTISGRSFSKSLFTEVTPFILALS
jgi:soluble cytochrome b562